MISYVVAIIWLFLTLLIPIERIIWANTKYVLFESPLNIDTTSEEWFLNTKCNNGWETIIIENVTKHRCGMWLPNTINIIKNN